MTDITATPGGAERPRNAYHTSPEAQARLKRRYAAETRFKYMGLGAIVIATGMLVLLLTSIVSNGYTAFFQTFITMEVAIPEDIDANGDRDVARLSSDPTIDWQAPFYDQLYGMFPELANSDDRTTERVNRKDLRDMISADAGYRLRQSVLEDPSIIGTTQEITFLGTDIVDQTMKGRIDRDLPEGNRAINDNQLLVLDALESQGMIETRFNPNLFTGSDSRLPERAGLGGSITGSFYLLVVCLAIAFPMAVATAIYLEEFAPKNKWTDAIEVNINNLAAVPSIVFGLLGLSVFIQFFGMPRSAALVGGLVIALMSLPTIIIASRAAIKAVPPSIREAALGMGASRLQAMMHHTLPLAMPGILTGTIIAMAQALGETAPLLMIGMNAFVPEIPSGITEPASVLPVQIYIWAGNPERGFVEKTSAAIMVLLAFLVVMNGTAIYLRKKFERRW